MDLRIVREPTRDKTTHGALYVNGHWHCWVLEDEIRERPGEPVEAWKIPRQTAIPAGRYRVVLTMSQRFKRVLPLLLDVPGFSGIRFHAGNDKDDTDGCLLVGTGRSLTWVTGSMVALERLLLLLAEAKAEPVWLTIENPPMLALPRPAATDVSGQAITGP